MFLNNFHFKEAKNSLRFYRNLRRDSQVTSELFKIELEKISKNENNFKDVNSNESKITWKDFSK